jgi:hypothetical protein
METSRTLVCNSSNNDNEMNVLGCVEESLSYVCEMRFILWDLSFCSSNYIYYYYYYFCAPKFQILSRETP